MGKINSFHNQGVLYDNVFDTDNAIKSYKRFLSISINNEDRKGAALAYNHLGVCYFFKGEFKDATNMHKLHYEVASNYSNKVHMYIHIYIHIYIYIYIYLHIHRYIHT